MRFQPVFLFFAADLIRWYDSGKTRLRPFASTFTNVTRVANTDRSMRDPGSSAQTVTS